MKLEGQVAIITGAAKGMGTAITRALAEEGARLTLAARQLEPLEELASSLREAGHQAQALSIDVSDEVQVQTMVEQTLDLYGGRIDVLVNVAGVTGPIETPIWEIEHDDYLAVITANIIGTFLPIKHVMPTMIEQRSGRIVNIGGTSGLRGYRFRTAYSSSKWAIRGLTRTVALEAGPYGIAVNNVVPGIVETPRMDKLCEEKARKRGWTRDEVYDEYVEETSLRSITTPEDIANAVVFAASEASRNMTGQDIIVDGGWMI
ncbi:MAG: SDR family NAD(P)-dependent oxidoreductase [Pseudomonadota bacterium]|nr:SDR family NAD(P)-dependent oxidoreductase [Pseudomonadota bacterium]